MELFTFISGNLLFHSANTKRVKRNKEEKTMKRPKNEVMYDGDLQGTEEFSQELSPRSSGSAKAIQEAWGPAAEKTKSYRKKEAD
ncbi:hypothetical protein EBO34_11965 [Alteribacter keqinensis]|uniref:Uncharacterized protein n=2 Tax=Alteribacter keqinensis TaxID=2483800 RepID=A0A3M7TP87_9BACI|nr:hypothetical protein EBO34_11965 [Alteribacter keqinensis]